MASSFTVEYSLTVKMMFCALFLLGTFQTTWGNAYIEIQFVKYTANCKEDINNNPCDPKFTWCLDRPRTSSAISPCYYGIVGESGHFQDTNSINLASLTTIQGIANPWVISIDSLKDPSLKLVTRIRDDDNFGDDHLITYGMTLTETVYGSRSEAVWADRSMSQSGYTIAFKIRVYCEAKWYQSDCTKFCEPQDTPDGHYFCEKGTGNKKCMTGWTGGNCTEDIDECALNFCERGTCENLPGDYICHCPAHYTGKNCTHFGDPCDTNPCSNNATCVSNLETYSYTCSCVGNWKGEHCDAEKQPCDFKPCQNGAECLKSGNGTNYTCDCKYPFTGDHCEARLPDATTTTTTTTTTAEVPVTEKPSLSQVVSDDDSGGFQPWHGILICILLLIPLVIIIVCLVVRRRRRKQKEKHDGLPPGDTVVVFSGGELAFENNMYNDVHRNGAHRQPPTTPTDDDGFNPDKPVFYPDDNDSEGATGGMGGYQDMDADGYVKPSSSMKSKPSVTTAARSPGLTRAQSNAYADFKSLHDKPAAEEVHYHDLDEMAMAVKGLEDAVKNEDDDFSAAALSFDMRSNNEDTRGERPYSDIPNNIPVPPVPPLRGISNKGLPLPPANDDDNVSMPEWTAPDPPSTSDYPYTEPVTPVKTGTQPKILSTFKEGPYAEVTLDSRPTSDPFANEVKVDEDDIPDAGLPAILGTTNGGYDTPTGSQRRHPSLHTQESQYDSPNSNQPSNRTSSSSEYDSPRSSHPAHTAPKPPVAPKPPTRSSSNKRHPEDHETGSELPSELNADEEEDLDAMPRNLKVREGYTFDDHDGHKFETNVDEQALIVENGKANSAQGLYMENHGFSLDDENNK